MSSENNKLIAEFMGLPKVDCNIGTSYGYITEGYMHPRVDVPVTTDGMQYKYSWDWLMPVVQKIGDDYYNTPFDETFSKLTEGYENIWTIEDTYKAVVEFIKENNKYICGSCGEFCNEYTYNEETDVDECNQCKKINQNN